jgi:aspartyl-tRNA(Asn)/glutamyl-tRNA(Gln) amidotransferase subunit C
MAKTGNISKQKIEHIAWLARIELSDEEKKLYTQQINKILEYFKIIEDAKTEDVLPTFNILGLFNVLREDNVKPSQSNFEALKNAPKKERGYFKTTKII